MTWMCAIDIFLRRRRFCNCGNAKPALSSRASAATDIAIPWAGPRRWAAWKRVSSFEQAVELTDGRTGETIRVRRLVIKLDQPTESGDTEIRLLTNLLPVNALKMAGSIASVGASSCILICTTTCTGKWTRWDKLQPVRRSLHCACRWSRPMRWQSCSTMALAHGEDVTEGLSGYCLADEIAGNYRAVDVLIEPAEDRDRLAAQSASSFWSWCLRMAKRIRPAAFAAHPRGPKRPAETYQRQTTAPLLHSSLAARR